MQPDHPTLRKCHATLCALYRDRLKGLILYGSCARGTDDTDSDIDLMVLLQGPVDSAQEIRQIWEVLYPVQLESEQLLSVIAVDAASYARGEYALYRHARAEGVHL